MWNWDWWTWDWINGLDAFESLMTGLALGVAGVWAFIKFVMEGYDEPSLHVKVICTLLNETAGATRMVSVRAEVTNVGKVPCQVNVPKSTLETSIVKGSAGGPTPVLEPRQPIMLGNDEIRNIPPGSTTAFVSFFQIDQPAVYGVVVFVHLAERAVRRVLSSDGVVETPEKLEGITSGILRRGHYRGA